MYYAGQDVHAQYVTIAVVDKSGTLVHETSVATREQERSGPCSCGESPAPQPLAASPPTRTCPHLDSRTPRFTGCRLTALPISCGVTSRRARRCGFFTIDALHTQIQ